MRNRLVILLILLMAALPVWSATVVCCDLQKMQQMAEARQMPAHQCCHDRQMPQQVQVPHHAHHAPAAHHCHAAGGTCHCDQLQHSQFVLGVPRLPVLMHSASLIPDYPALQPLAGRHETLYRPPIA